MGEVIRAYRIHKEITVRELGAEIGISHATLSRMERGEAIEMSTGVLILSWLLSASKRAERRVKKESSQ